MRRIQEYVHGGLNILGRNKGPNKLKGLNPLPPPHLLEIKDFPFPLDWLGGAFLFTLLEMSVFKSMS